MKNLKKILLGLALGLSLGSNPIQAGGADIDFDGIADAIGGVVDLVDNLTDPIVSVVSGAVSGAKKLGGKAIDVGKSLWNKVF